jgi:acyl-coenzyme A thioesterase PaaI-like protein
VAARRDQGSAAANGVVSAVAIQDQLGVENHCFGCGRDNPDGLHIKSYVDGDETVCRFRARSAFMAGPRHILNGGIIATVIDCHCVCTAIAAAYAAEGRAIGSAPTIWCATASMDVTYLRPTPIGEEATLRAHVESSDGKRFTIACTLESGGKERARGRVVAVRVPPSWRDA